MGILFGVIILAFIMLVSEILWYKQVLREEKGRKFVHILAGSFIAFWPFFMSWYVIQIWALLALLAVIFLRKRSFFKTGYDVERRSWGELWFLASIFLAASYTTSSWVFCAAILHLALADGMAGLIGKHYSRKNYKVFAAQKSVIGTVTFIVTSMLITGLFLMVYGSGNSNAALIFLVVPMGSALLENISAYGLDNVTVPMFAAVALQTLS